jgi:hypothetical protein
LSQTKLGLLIQGLVDRSVSVNPISNARAKEENMIAFFTRCSWSVSKSFYAF